MTTPRSSPEEPCPFCESNDCAPSGQDACWQVLCNHCHATGPSAGNPEDALRYWRERPVAALQSAPDRVLKSMKCVLEQPYWPQTLKAGETYQRYEDDSREGFVAVTFGGDGDAHIMLNAEQDPHEHKWSFRFRMPMIGGGESPRVRNALLILAEAIRLDNEEHPQHR